jgi:FlaA1/EpsC-like NDP-sugar epimerase
VRVNVGGTRTVLRQALEHGVDRFVLVSTDKAVLPESVMGGTKRVAEKLVLAAAKSSGRQFSVVRFGNVLGSRGSVVPTFARQIELGGPVTITHPEATRFFMELSEAAILVLQAAALAGSGETLMLDMGERIRVDDLARKMIRLRGLRPETDIPIAYVGLRPGEKLHEELLYAGEQRRPTEHPHIFRFQGDPAGDEAVLQRDVDALLDLARMGRRTDLARTLRQVAAS